MVSGGATSFQKEVLEARKAKAEWVNRPNSDSMGRLFRPDLHFRRHCGVG